MEGFKVFNTDKPESIASLLLLTGQGHIVPFIERYDRVISLLGKELIPFGQWSTVVIGAVGINDEENRIVDIAVHPDFRRKGLGRLLVELSGCTTAYAVTDEARDFWNGIGWAFIGARIDKGTEVDIFSRTVKLNE